MPAGAPEPEFEEDEEIFDQFDGRGEYEVIVSCHVGADASYAPGTGSSTFSGSTPRELMPYLRQFCAKKTIVGMDEVIDEMIGLGPIGLMFVRLAKLAGAHVIAVDAGRVSAADAGRIGG